MLYIVHKLYLLLPVLSRHFGHLVGAWVVLLPSSCSPVSEAEVLFNVIFSFKVKLLRCGLRGLPCPLFDVAVVVVVVILYSGKVLEAFPITPSRYEMTSKIVAWGPYLYSTISTTKVDLKIYNLPNLEYCVYAWSPIHRETKYQAAQQRTIKLGIGPKNNTNRRCSLRLTKLERWRTSLIWWLHWVLQLLTSRAGTALERIFTLALSQS